MHIAANKNGPEANPAAAKLFEIMKVSVADINAQNLRMHNGQNHKQILNVMLTRGSKHIKKQHDGWVEEARKAAN